MKKVVIWFFLLASCSTKEDINSASKQIDANMNQQEEFDRLLKDMDQDKSSSRTGEEIADSLGWTSE